MSNALLCNQGLSRPIIDVREGMPIDVTRERPLERQHKALLIVASVMIKTVLMVIVSTQIICGGADPRMLFSCGENVAYVGGSAAAVALRPAQRSLRAPRGWRQVVAKHFQRRRFLDGDRFINDGITQPLPLKRRPPRLRQY